MYVRAHACVHLRVSVACVCVCVCVRVSQLVRGMQRVYECKGVWESGNSKPRYSAPSSYGRQLETAAWSSGMVSRAGVSASATWCTLQRVSLGVLKRDYNINARTVSEHEPTNKPTRLERKKKKKKATRHSQPQRPSF